MFDLYKHSYEIQCCHFFSYIHYDCVNISDALQHIYRQYNNQNNVTTFSLTFNVYDSEVHDIEVQSTLTY